MLKGIIIEESLRDREQLKKLRVIATRISRTMKWHMHTVSVTKNQVYTIAKNLDSSGKWYVHFWDTDGNIIAAFSTGVIYEFNYYKKATWKPAVEHGLAMGIPLEQLDFVIESAAPRP